MLPFEKQQEQGIAVIVIANLTRIAFVVPFHAQQSMLIPARYNCIVIYKIIPSIKLIAS